jgi:hypothetical protein
MLAAVFFVSFSIGNAENEQTPMAAIFSVKYAAKRGKLNCKFFGGGRKDFFKGMSIAHPFI